VEAKAMKPVFIFWRWCERYGSPCGRPEIPERQPYAKGNRRCASWTVRL